MRARTVWSYRHPISGTVYYTDKGRAFAVRRSRDFASENGKPYEAPTRYVKTLAKCLHPTALDLAEDGDPVVLWCPTCGAFRVERGGNLEPWCAPKRGRS